MPHVFKSLFLELSLGHHKMIVGVVYRPNTYPHGDIEIFSHNMNELQNILGNEHKDAYIMGDMNIDRLKFNDHGKTGEYIDNIFSHGFMPLILKPTRITPHSKTLIDHIYTNQVDTNIISGIVVCDIADHLGIFAAVKRKKVQHRGVNDFRPYI